MGRGGYEADCGAVRVNIFTGWSRVRRVHIFFKKTNTQGGGLPVRIFNFFFLRFAFFYILYTEKQNSVIVLQPRSNFVCKLLK